MKRLRHIAIAVLAVLACAPAASAATRNWAFSDSTTVSTASVQTNLALLRSTTCQLPGARPAAVGLTAALTSAQQILVRFDGPRALHRFAVSSAARSYRAAMTAAAAAMLDNRPDAALAALLRAHALAPRDPRPLVDASVLLTDDGLPNQALALLHAAAAMHQPGRPPYGISRVAELENNEGYALIALHRWSAAAIVLGAAHRRAPLLTEVERNLAAVDVCTGHAAHAQQLLQAAARRDRFASAQVIVNPVKGTSVPNAAATFDLAKGQTPGLPQITIPPNASQGAAAWPEFAALSQQQNSAASTDATTVGQDNLKLATMRLAPATRQRILDIISAIGSAEGQDPTIKPLADARTAALVAEGYAMRTYSQQGCAARGVWLSAQAALDTAENRLAIAEYQFDTGLAANLATPLAHQLALAMARSVIEGEFAASELAPIALVGQIGDRVCSQPAQQQQDITGSLSTPSVPPCPSGLQGVDFSLNLSVVSFSVNCEEVSVGASTPGWIGAFGTVSHNFGTGSTTIFAGPQVGATIQAGPFGGGAQAQAGGYITITGDGTISDVGMRGTVSAGGSIGPASTYTGTSLDFSFVAAR